MEGFTGLRRCMYSRTSCSNCNCASVKVCCCHELGDHNLLTIVSWPVPEPARAVVDRFIRRISVESSRLWVDLRFIRCVTSGGVGSGGDSG